MAQKKKVAKKAGKAPMKKTPAKAKSTAKKPVQKAAKKSSKAQGTKAKPVLKMKLAAKDKLASKTNLAAKSKTKAKPAAKAKLATKSKVNAKPPVKAKMIGKNSKSSAASGAKATQPVAKAQILKPLDDRIVIQLKSFEKRTSGGLYIPDTADVSGNFQGTVVSVGQGHKNKKGKLRPMDVKPGDEVLFDQHAGSKLTLEGVEVRILRESEVSGIVETK